MEGDVQNCAFVAAVLERSRGAKVILDAGATDVIGALPRRVIEARSGVERRRVVLITDVAHTARRRAGAFERQR